MTHCLKPSSRSQVPVALPAASAFASIIFRSSGVNRIFSDPPRCFFFGSFFLPISGLPFCGYMFIIELVGTK